MAAVAVSAGENEMRYGGNEDRENNEDEPGEARGPCIGLIDAEPFEPGAEAIELVMGAGGASREGLVLVGVLHHQAFCFICHHHKSVFRFWEVKLGNAENGNEICGSQLYLSANVFI